MSQPKKLTDTIKKTLILGDFQSGKTSGQVQNSYNIQSNNPSVVSVFVAYGTNTNKENQERHIRRVYGKNVILLSSNDDLKAFLICLQKDNVKGSRYLKRCPVVISVLGHYVPLQVLQKILTTKSPFTYRLWLDESDSYSLDFDNQTVQVRKDNIVDSISKLDYHSVEEVYYLTATPFTELVSCTDFNEVKDVPPGKGYKGINDIIENASSISSDDILFFENGKLTEDIKTYLDEENSFKETVTLISTNSAQSTHKIQARTINNYLQDENTLVVEFNSNEGTKYFSHPENPYVPAKTNRKDQLVEMFEVAQNYSKLFVIGWKMLGRSVTLKEGRFQTYSSMLFSSGKESGLSSFMQRAARICGYQDSTPRFISDKLSQAELNNYDYPTLVKVCKENKKHTDRRTALLNLSRDEIVSSDPLGRYRNNSFRPHGSQNKVVQQWLSTIDKVRDAGYDLITKHYIIKKEKIPEQVLKQLQNKNRAGSTSALKAFLDDLFPACNRVLQAISEKGENYADRQRPNRINDTENYRDTLYYWDGETLSVSNQPYQSYNKRYAMYDLKTKNFRCYDHKAAFKIL
tara:strand:+ start:74 stop:1798 length:1725 start_codon:yes stop_codon:yes gene_type:complete